MPERVGSTIRGEGNTRNVQPYQISAVGEGRAAKQGSVGGLLLQKHMDISNFLQPDARLLRVTRHSHPGVRTEDAQRGEVENRTPD